MSIGMSTGMGINIKSEYEYRYKCLMSRDAKRGIGRSAECYNPYTVWIVTYTLMR